MVSHTPETAIPAEHDPALILERPDGFYWRDTPGEKEYGPFASLLEAKQDMEGQFDSSYEEGETLEDAEEEIGISSWIDPDTGEPAEDMATRRGDE